MTTTCSRLLLCSTLALGLAAPALAWPLNDSEEPGSVIVFHKFIRGTTFTTEGLSVPKTTFEISAVCPPHPDPTGPVVCAELGQTIRLKAHWVCPGVGDDNICRETDFDLSLTVNGTVVFDAAGPGGNGAAPLPPCRRGYLIAWVVDDTGAAIKFDGLIGDAVIRASSTGARAYNALPIQAVEWLSTGQPTDTNANGALDFNGRDDYKAITGTIFGNVRYEDAQHTTDLTLLTLDVHSGAPNDLTTASLNFYNENEDVISTAKNFRCWTEDSLTDIDPNLSTNFGGKGGVKGLVKSTSATQNGVPVTLVGIVETIETLEIPVDIPVPPQSVTTTVPFPVEPSTAVCLALPNPPFCQINRTCGFEPFPVFVCHCVSATCNFTFSPADAVTTIFGTRDYSYSLYNDSNPVETTFFPTAPPAPPQP